VRQEKTLMGSYYGSANPPVDFPKLARLFLDGKLPINRLASHVYKLDAINTAYADMLAGRTLRGLIHFTDR
jgi:Zn-dependent alcohol dehydrogenase